MGGFLRLLLIVAFTCHIDGLIRNHLSTPRQKTLIRPGCVKQHVLHTTLCHTSQQSRFWAVGAVGAEEDAWTAPTAADSSAVLEPAASQWFTALDKKIWALAIPAILNFAIIPLCGAIDTAFVGRMRQELALAGQGGANQVFSSIFWIISFIPNVITPLVAKAVGNKDKEAVQDRVGEAIFISTVMGVIGCINLISMPERALGLVLAKDAPAMQYAMPYLRIRAFTFLPAILSTVAFAVFRGSMDVVTPLKISVLSNIVNIALDPLLIFNAGMGVAGAAAATCVSELVGFILYTRELLKRNMMSFNKVFRVPSMKALTPMLVGGLAVQMRAIALNIAFLAVTRTTQALDTTGTAAAAHAITMQLWQLGGVILLAMSTVASIIIPTTKAEAKKPTADRLLQWGMVLGVTLASVQLLCLPLLGFFSPLQSVQEAARLPSIFGAALQLMNGVVFIGEGIQTGNQAFFDLAACTGVATAGMLLALRRFGHTLPGVWASFAVFNGIRLAGVLHHHFTFYSKVDKASTTVAKA